MKIVKLLARGILIIFMMLLVLQLITTVQGLVSASSQKPEVFSFLIGRLVGTLLIFALLAWTFKKMGEDTPKKK